MTWQAWAYVVIIGAGLVGALVFMAMYWKQSLRTEMGRHLQAFAALDVILYSFGLIRFLRRSVPMPDIFQLILALIYSAVIVWRLSLLIRTRRGQHPGHPDVQ